MNPIQHATSNDVLRPPAGATPEECRHLYITRTIYHMGDGKQIPGIVSYWKPSQEQLALLNSGAPVFLSCLGLTHPPFSIGVEGDGRL